jgi:hypothetical protein
VFGGVMGFCARLAIAEVSVIHDWVTLITCQLKLIHAANSTIEICLCKYNALVLATKR